MSIILSPNRILKLASIVTLTAPEIAKEFGDGSTGGYFYASDAQERMLLRLRAAKPAEEKVRKYMELSVEKPARLHRHPEHLLSWQSKNPEADEWDGALRIENSRGYLSFSGFPGPVDETSNSVWGFHTGCHGMHYSKKLADISGNRDLLVEINKLVRSLI